MRDIKEPRVVVSYSGGNGGCFILSMFEYLFYDLPMTLDTSVGNAHHTNTQLLLGPEYSLDETYFQDAIAPLLPPRIRRRIQRNPTGPTGDPIGRIWFSTVVNELHNKADPLIHAILNGKDSSRSNGYQVDRTHLINRDLLNQWYNKNTYNTEIITITATTLDEVKEALRRVKFKNREFTKQEIVDNIDNFFNTNIDRVKAIINNTPAPNTTDNLLSFSSIMNKDSKRIHQFVLSVCEKINLRVSKLQSLQLEKYIDQYLDCQPIL